MVESSLPTRLWRRLRARRGLHALAVLPLAAVLAAPAAASVSGGAGATSLQGSGALRANGIAITGHGFGHGIGLSQWGAEERAAAGQSYRQILSFYYPGTVLSTAPADTTVRILVAEQARVRLGSSSPFTLRDAQGRAVRLPRGHFWVSTAGRLGSRQVEFPLTAQPGTAPLQVGATRYRGTITVKRAGDRLRAIDTLGLEEYLVGVVSSENPGYWPQDALRAQAVASRTYALASLRPESDFDLYPDDRSQNYHGLQKEFASAAAAVGATQQQVLLYDGRPITAFFSASNGGLTSGVEGVWGGVPLPYLVSRLDPFDARSPASDWGPVKVNLDRLKSAFPGLPAGVASISISRNAAERAVGVTFVGTDGSTYQVAGRAFQQRLGLRSTYLTIAPAQS